MQNIITGLCLFLCISVTSHYAMVDQRINVLITDGFSNHDWEHTTRCIKAILEVSKKVNVSVSTFPVNGTPDEIKKWNPDFKSYDVIIQTCNDIGKTIHWSRETEMNLENFVKNGGGLYIFHSANNAFPEWKEYNQMIGLGWRKRNFGWAITINSNGSEVRIPAGQGNNTGHGKRVNALLTRIGEHPVHEGLPEQWKAADLEIYHYARGPAENLTVLSYAQDFQTQLNFPIEWVVNYGKGRVYNSTFGHVWKNQDKPKGICCAGFQTVMLRAIQWLADVEIDTVLPWDFPTKDNISLREYPLINR